MRVPSPLRIVACATVLSTSCAFPEVTFDTTATGGSGAAGGATGTSTGTAGSGGSGASGGDGGSGAGAGGGATTISSTGGGGSGGVGGGGSGGGTTTSSSTTSSAGGSGGSTCAEDFDNDTFIAWCAGGPDCADEDPTAHPGADYDSAPIVGATKPNTNPFDRDCNGAVQRETLVLTCPNVAPCGSAQGYQAAVACGQFGVLGKCVSDFILGCKWAALSPMIEKQQKCK